MKALAFLGIGKVGIVNKPMPELGPNDAVIKTTLSIFSRGEDDPCRTITPVSTRGSPTGTHAWASP